MAIWTLECLYSTEKCQVNSSLNSVWCLPAPLVDHPRILGTTKFELVTASKPDRGGIMSTFSRNKAVADFLEWPIGVEFYAYFASRPGTTL